MLDGRISLGTNKPSLINTVLGYIVAGSTNTIQQQTKCNVNVALNFDLQKF